MKTSEKQAIADRLREYVAAKQSQQKAANSMHSVSAATISQMLNGNWEQITDQMWRTVASQAGYDPRNWAIVETEGYRRMYDILTDAQSGSMVFAVTGDAGCGKTQAIKAYAGRNRNVLALSCSEYWNRRQFLAELLQSLGVEASGSTVAELVADAVHQLKRRENILLILDEADKLSDQVLHFFITLYNKLEDHCGIVICATQYLEKRIRRGVMNNRKGYKEIYSRIGRKFIPMPVVHAGDVAAVCIANGVKAKPQIEQIADDCDCDLRRVKRLVFAIKEDSNAD